MSLEGGPRPEKIPDKPVQLYMTEDGTLWIRSPFGNVIILDDAAEEERDRQQQNPDSAPAAGYPKFSERVRHAEIPAEGARAPEEDEEGDAIDAKSPGAQEGEPEVKPEAQPEAKPEVKPNHDIDALKDKLDKRNAPKQPESRERLSLEDQHAIVMKRILLQADPNYFRLVQNSEWTGKDGELQRYYETPALPGLRFTEAQYQWMRNGKQGPMPPSAGGGGSGGGAGEPPQGNERGGESPRGGSAGEVARGPQRTAAEGGFDWSVHKPEYKGLSRKVKTVEELVDGTGPHELHFGRLVDSLGLSDAKRKLLEGERLSAEEKKGITFARYEYARRMEQIVFIESKLNTADLEVVARRSDEFRDELGFRGSEKTLAIFKREIYRLGMTNREELDRLFNTYTNLTNLREKKIYKAWEKSVQNLCEKRGIDIDDYKATYRTGDKGERVETRRQIQEDIRSNWGPFRRAMDKVTLIGSSWRKADRDVRLATRLDEATRLEGGTIKAVDDELTSLAAVLKYTIVDNPEVDLIVQQGAVQGKDLRSASESGPHTFSESKQRSADAHKNIGEAIDKHVSTVRVGGRDWAHMTESERSTSLGPLRAAQESAARIAMPGGGFWASALRALFLAFLARKQSEVIHKPVAA